MRIPVLLQYTLAIWQRALKVVCHLAKPFWFWFVSVQVISRVIDMMEMLEADLVLLVVTRYVGYSKNDHDLNWGLLACLAVLLNPQQQSSCCLFLCKDVRHKIPNKVSL